MKYVVILLLLLVHHTTFTQISEQEFTIETQDLARFWEAFEKFEKDTTKNPFVEYLESGSRGLQLLQKFRITSPDSFKSVIRNELPYYKQIEANSLSIDSIVQQSLKHFSKFKAIYPPATLPKVYFAIGQLNTFITTVNDTIIFCLENFPETRLVTSSGDSSSTIAALPLFLFRTFIYANHRPAHTGHTLLRESILYGGVSFIASLLVEEERTRLLTSSSFRYGETHEEQLVKEFLLMKDERELAGWFYPNNDKNRPGDLGKWIGFKIIESYYHNTPDKSKAINDILKINDFDRFLRLSGYLDVFQN